VLKDKSWIFLTQFYCVLMLKNVTALKVLVFWDLTVTDWMGVTA